MSTTRPYPAGDRGPEPEGAATTAAAPQIGHAGAGAGPGATASAGGVGTGQLNGGAAGFAPPAAHGAAGDTGTSGTPGAAGAPEGVPAGDAPTQDRAERDRPLRQVRRLRLVGASGAVARARDFTRQALQDWGWLPAATADQQAAAEDVLLVVSELVTNACLHADGPEEVRIGSSPKLLRLEVVDTGSGAPAPRTPHRAGRPGGHGMFIVQRLCLDWGVVRSPEGAGKTVWAELAAPN
ncbi:ATP-binding protein [Streptomyces phytohabitans]|uniref:ATP-binding protein n=1 Tax=Streptomyces phytohabitans TaxID=1150371 RepID=UPI00387E9B2B